MENENPVSIPYIVHEAEMARAERMQRRLWVLCIIIFLALVGTNAGWIIYESQFIDEISIESSSEGGGDAYGTLISGNGSTVNYGERESNEEKN